MLRMFYFSGTGNARNVARWMVDAWRERGPGRRGDRPGAEWRVGTVEIGPDDDIGLASPTHGFNFPPITLAFLFAFPRTTFGQPSLHHQHPGGRPAVRGVCSRAERRGAASGRARVRCSRATVWSACGPSTFPPAGSRCIRDFGRTPSGRSMSAARPSPGGSRTACSTAVAICGRSSTCRRICCSRRSPSATTSSAGSSSRSRSSPRPRAMPAACASSQCPVQAIRLVAGRPFWSHRCESCMRCMNHCPKRAIETAHGFVAGFLFLFDVAHGGPDLSRLAPDCLGPVGRRWSSPRWPASSSRPRSCWRRCSCRTASSIADSASARSSGSSVLTSLTHFGFWRRYRPPHQLPGIVSADEDR